MKYHYVYRITNKELNNHYYGVRSSILEPKLDLGIKYFSSSTNKEFLNEQKVNPIIFKYKVIKIFETRKDANLYESKIHRKFEVHKNENFYNISMSTGNAICLLDKRSDEHKQNISKSLKGKKKSSEHLQNLSKALRGREPWNKGVKLSEEKKSQIKEKLQPRTKEHQQNIINSKRKNGTLKHKEETKKLFSETRKGENNSFYGKTHSKETIQKIIDANKIKITCPYCLKTGGQSAMKRWHFDKCKLKEEK